MVGIRHGKVSPVSCYARYRCRTAECTAAWSERMREDREKRSKQPIPAEVHGTDNGYGNYKCRCGDCRAAHAEATARYRAERERERLVYGLVR